MDHLAQAKQWMKNADCTDDYLAVIANALIALVEAEQKK